MSRKPALFALIMAASLGLSDQVFCDEQDAHPPYQTLQSSGPQPHVRVAKKPTVSATRNPAKPSKTLPLLVSLAVGVELVLVGAFWGSSSSQSAGRDSRVQNRQPR